MPAGATDVRFWMWNDYVIEEDWDFGFVEVSTDGGTTWTEQKVFDEDGAEVTTPDGYPDPNGNLADFGGKKYGLTGHIRRLAPRLHRPHAVRRHRPSACGCGYATDAAFQERGWFADDFSVTADGTTDLERRRRVRRERLDRRRSAPVADTPVPAGASTPAPRRQAQYYLVEWRNFDGFDEGLKYAYDTDYQPKRARGRSRRSSTTRPACWSGTATPRTATPTTCSRNLTALPSGGAQGRPAASSTAHFDPLRRTGEAADASTRRR